MKKRREQTFCWNLVLLIFFCGPFILMAIASTEEKDPPQSSPPAQQNDYVGSETCAGCHDELVKSFERNPHNSKAFEKKSDLECESCHGPGAAHAAEGDPALIKSIKRMTESESSDTCVSCHDTGKQMHWEGSVHDLRELGCASCHSVHQAKSDKALLKVSRVDDQCATCHLPVKAQIQRTSHHPLREGLMSCVSCHNPHGTETPKMIAAASVTEQCYSCHTEKRGPFLWEHPPVKENCLSCHMPHGSNHEKLLAEKRPYLCQSCHLNTRHPGTLYDGTPGSLASNREFSRSCSNCHLTIHGSNHPSGWTFLR